VAGPLLVASMTTNPTLVAGAVFVQQLPWLLFALPAGAFVFLAAALLAAALLVAPLLRRHGPAPVPAAVAAAAGRDRRGLGWLWRHRVLRLLAVCLAVMNLAGAGTFAIWVLWARQRLGLQCVGFGALVTAYAAGSQLVLALTRSPWIAGATLILFGAHAIVWGVVTVASWRRFRVDAPGWPAAVLKARGAQS
jgi:hypothetical protein